MVRHTDLEMSIMKEEILALRLLAAEDMATMQLPVERHGMGQEEEKPRVKSKAKPGQVEAKVRQKKVSLRVTSAGQATSSQPFSGPVLGRRVFGLIWESWIEAAAGDTGFRSASWAMWKAMFP